jgi:hypothetical protein
MSGMRILIAGLTSAALIALLGWQIQRERMVKACLDGGGVWYGARSACAPHPLRPILQRDLQRG